MTLVAAQARIAAIDYALPARRVTNQDLAARHPEWPMAEISKRTGVQERHWAETGETALDLAETACRRLFARMPQAAEADVLLVCCQTPDRMMPANSFFLQRRLGLRRNLAAFDINLACSGFVYGLWLATSLIRSGQGGRVLLVCGDTYSKLLHPDDRSSLPLFGDGVAAILVEKADQTAIGPFELGADGAAAETFWVPAGGARQPLAAWREGIWEVDQAALDGAFIQMRGAAVLDFVKTVVPANVRGLLAQADIAMDAVDLVVLHQASQLSCDYIYNVLDIPEAKRYTNIATVGNTVSASIPLALRQAEETGRLRAGMRVMLVGFGVGLSWGSALLRW